MKQANSLHSSVLYFATVFCLLIIVGCLSSSYNYEGFACVARQKGAPSSPAPSPFVSSPMNMPSPASTQPPVYPPSPTVYPPSSPVPVNAPEPGMVVYIPPPAGSIMGPTPFTPSILGSTTPPSTCPNTPLPANTIDFMQGVERSGFIKYFFASTFRICWDADTAETVQELFRMMKLHVSEDYSTRSYLRMLYKFYVYKFIKNEIQLNGIASAFPIRDVSPVTIRRDCGYTVNLDTAVTGDAVYTSLQYEHAPNEWAITRIEHDIVTQYVVFESITRRGFNYYRKPNKKQYLTIAFSPSDANLLSAPSALFRYVTMSAVSSTPPPVPNTTALGTPLTQKPRPTGNTIHFMVLNDIHYGLTIENRDPNNPLKLALPVRRPFNIEAAVTRARNLDNPFMILCGDVTESGTQEHLELLINGMSSTTVNVPVYPGLGNHDGSIDSPVVNYAEDYVKRNPGMFDVISESLSQYVFEVKGVHFVHLGVTAGIDDRYQGSLEFLKMLLATRISRTAPFILFQHFGVTSYGWWSAEERLMLWSILKGYNVLAIFHGHHHGDHVLHLWNGVETAGRSINSSPDPPLLDINCVSISDGYTYPTVIVDDPQASSGTLVIRNVLVDADTNVPTDKITATITWRNGIRTTTIK